MSILNTPAQSNQSANKNSNLALDISADGWYPLRHFKHEWCCTNNCSGMD
ncbi:MAG: hypothetical protein H0U75_04895 [Legionella sp.]|nr:hypothetical protein [Legionella sp.]